MNFRQTRDYLGGLGIPFHTLRIPGARALVTPIGARILALEWEGMSENPLYIHPGLGKLREQIPHRFVEGGGIGGDRLWVSPEYRYFWEGEPRLDDFSNYDPPAAVDPGCYNTTVPGEDGIVFDLNALLPGGVRVGIRREITLIPSDLTSGGMGAVGVCIRHRLELLEGPDHAEAGLWSILQVPAGSCILIPTSQHSEEIVRVTGDMGGRLRSTPGSLSVGITGDAFAKIGVLASMVVGRAAVWQSGNNGSACLLVREFPVHPELHYGDALVREQVSSQAVQVFDGLGFGELETHSPCVTPRDPVREETTYLWAVSGEADAVKKTARETFSIVAP